MNNVRTTHAVRRSPATWVVGTVMLLAALATIGLLPGKGRAATSTGCEGGGFSVLGISGKRDVTLRAGQLPATFLVKGKYVEFTIVSSTFGITGYTFTGAPNPLDMTGGRRTVVFASKRPTIAALH